MITSTHFNILWNGLALPTFPPCCGIRQDDHFHPIYLFILCLEHLSILLNEATQRKWIQPMTFRDQLRISHLFFVLFVVGLVKLLVHTNPKFSFPQILKGDPRRSYKVFLKFLLLLVGSCFVQYPSPMVMKGSRPPKDGV